MRIRKGRKERKRSRGRRNMTAAAAAIKATARGVDIQNQRE